MKQLILFFFLSITISAYSCQSNEDTLIKVKPDAIIANNLGTEHLSNLNFDSAAYYLIKAIRIDSTYLLPRINLIGMYLEFPRIRDHKKALKYCEDLLILDSSNAELWFKTGLIQEYIGDTIKAADSYQTALALFSKELNVFKGSSMEKDNININIGLCNFMLKSSEYSHYYDKVSKQSTLKPMATKLKSLKRNEILEELLY